MDPAAMRTLVAGARVGRLATVAPDGRPHVVPVCFVLAGTMGTATGGTGEAVYSAVDDKPKRTRQLRRTANILATGAACLLVDHYEEDWSRLWWVRLDGRGRVVDDADELGRAAAALRAKYPQYESQSLAGPMIALDIERWRAWSAGR